MNTCYLNGVRFVTSIITYLEFCVKPYQEQRLDLIEDYQNLIKEADVVVSTLTFLDCDRAARLRAKYPGVKAFDALQLALAIKEGCDVFACHDKRLKVVNEIEIMTLDDFKNRDVTQSPDVMATP